MLYLHLSFYYILLLQINKHVSERNQAASCASVSDSKQMCPPPVPRAKNISPQVCYFHVYISTQQNSFRQYQHRRQRQCHTHRQLVQL
jgi:hypothetical protein